jgi:hypothetical protein
MGKFAEAEPLILFGYEGLNPAKAVSRPKANSGCPKPTSAQ